MSKAGVIVATGITVFIAIGAAAFSTAEVDAQQGNTQSAGPIASSDTPVVLELFTSQGCSSCPPADELATRLAADPSLLVITRPVTYWDRLGWKDTLARPENTDLQRSYAKRGNEGAGVYTPQIVVDGRHGAVGSNRRNVTALARDAGMKVKPALASSRQTDGTVSISISGRIADRSRLSLVALSSHETVQIARGENGGRTIHYTNVLVSEVPIGKASNSSREFTIASGEFQNDKADRYAVILRQGTDGPILAGKSI